MPDITGTKISALDADSNLNDSDYLAGVDVNASPIKTKKFTLSALKTFFQSGLTKSSVGLGNVDNTSDANKPVSTAQQAAIDAVGVHFGVCSTAEGTAEKEVSITGITSLYDGLKITVQFTNQNTAATISSPAKLNVNSLGAKDIKVLANMGVPNNFWNAGEVLELIYLSASDAWLIINGGYATTSQYGRTKLNNTINSDSTFEAATASAVKAAYNRAVNAEEQAELARVYTDSIVFSLSWSGSDPYTQTVVLLDTDASTQTKVDLQPTAAQLAQLIADGVTAITIENNGGTLTAYALGATPSTAMTIACTVTEVV